MIWINYDLISLLRRLYYENWLKLAFMLFAIERNSISVSLTSEVFMAKGPLLLFPDQQSSFCFLSFRLLSWVGRLFICFPGSFRSNQTFCDGLVLATTRFGALHWTDSQFWTLAVEWCSLCLSEKVGWLLLTRTYFNKPRYK